MRSKTITFILFVLFTLSMNIKAQNQIPVEMSTVVMMDELDAFFYQAAVNFINFKDLEAAEDVKKALFFIFYQADKASSKTVFNNVTVELNKLSFDLIRGSVEDIQRLKRTFARTHYTLANYYIQEANKSIEKSELNKALYELNASSNYLALGVKWIGYEMSEGTRSTRKSIYKLNKAIAARETINPQEVKKVAKFLESEVVKFGIKLGEKTKKYDSYSLDIETED